MKIPENPLNPLPEKSQIVTPKEASLNDLDNRYEEGEAFIEAFLIKLKIEEGEAKNYAEAEKLVEKDFQEHAAMVKSVEPKIKSFINKEDSLENIIASLPKEKRSLFWYHLIVHTKEFNDLDHVDIAHAIIDSNEGGLLGRYLEKFQGLDHNDIANRLIESGRGREVANFIEKFNGLDHKEILDKILDSGNSIDVVGTVRRISKLKNIDVNAVAHKLIDRKYRGRVVILRSFLSEVDGLDSEIADKLIDTGNAEEVVLYIEKFKNINSEELISNIFSNKLYEHSHFGCSAAKKIIAIGQTEKLANNLNKFFGLDSEVAFVLIDEGEERKLMSNIERFNTEDHNSIINKLLEAEEDIIVAENLNKFKELKGDIAIALIETGIHGDDVSRNIRSFKSSDHPAIALALIDNGYGYILAENIIEFEGVDNTEIAERILEEDKEEGIEEVTNNLENFHDLSKEIAKKLFDHGLERDVADNIKSFKDEDHIAIANSILDSSNESGCRSLAKNLGNFKGINSLEVARKLIQEDYIDEVSENLKNFHGLDQAIAITIINNHDASFADNLESFENLDISLAIKLVEHGYGNNLNTHLKVFNLPPEVENIIESHHLILSEALVYYQASPEEKAEKSIVEILKVKVPEWQDELNTSSPFEEGSKIFGEDKMFEYLNRKGLTRHDGLHEFNNIIQLYRISDLSPKEFYNNILRQVNDDESEYYNGTAHHQLNDLSRNAIEGFKIEDITGMSSIPADMFEFEKVKKIVGQYKHIEKLSKFFQVFNTVKDVFSSWKNLKKYSEVYNLLEQKDILDQLSKFKDFPEKKKLQDYIETLAFHRNISMDKVLSFWRSPEKFFDLPDSHTPTEAHNRKKPSNFIEFPNLDLSAEELRDSLVEGDYDAIQSFRPFSIEYGLSKNNYSSEQFVSALNRALGKRSESKKGEAKNPPKLFKELKKLSQERQISFQDLLAGNIEISDEDKTVLLTSLYRKDIGLSRPDVKIETYRAKINKKSDPDAVVAGNDTACCMPFGSGKNNVYTFNPNCSLFTLQKQSNNGKWRTIAQSVLTEDVYVGRKIPDIISDFQKGEKHLNELLTDDVLAIQKSFIACDNIEVAGSFSDKKDEIKFIYQDFFREYLKQFSNEDNIEDSKIIIGKGYTDALTDLPHEENKFIPRAPVSYSDKLGNKVYTLSMLNNLQTKLSIFDKKIIEQESFPKAPPIDFLPQGVELLTFRDALPVAYIEGKAYADNESLIEYLHNMENVLIAKDVNNSTKKRPNMSLKYIGDDNKMHGYILAYEGRMHKRGENVVYISDLASDKNIRAGGSLLIAFTEMYKRNYIDTGKIIPIYAQLRENTSYPIIKKQLDKLAKGTGIKFQMKEVRTYTEGNDLMYEVMILPISSNENLI